MKSLEYIKQRIAERNTDLSECNYESMIEINTVDIFEEMYQDVWEHMEYSLSPKMELCFQKYIMIRMQILIISQ